MEIAARVDIPERRRARRELKAVLKPIFSMYRTILPPTDALSALTEDLGTLLPQFEHRPRTSGTGTQDVYKTLLRLAEERGTLLDAHGGSLSAEHVGRLLNLSKTRVLLRHKQGSLLGVRIDKQNAVRFPIWQFYSDPVQVRPGIAETISVFRAGRGQADWSALAFFVRGPDNGNRSAPMELLEAGRIPELLRCARQHLKTAAHFPSIL
jgi:hypothetical protein